LKYLRASNVRERVKGILNRSYWSVGLSNLSLSLSLSLSRSLYLSLLLPRAIDLMITYYAAVHVRARALLPFSFFFFPLL